MKREGYVLFKNFDRYIDQNNEITVQLAIVQLDKLSHFHITIYNYESVIRSLDHLSWLKYFGLE
jgi:hypothetical protein